MSCKTSNSRGVSFSCMFLIVAHARAAREQPSGMAAPHLRGTWVQCLRSRRHAVEHFRKEIRQGGVPSLKERGTGRIAEHAPRNASVDWGHGAVQILNRFQRTL